MARTWRVEHGPCAIGLGENTWIGQPPFSACFFGMRCKGRLVKATEDCVDFQLVLLAISIPRWVVPLASDFGN